jgi:hypothetical protein
MSSNRFKASLVRRPSPATPDREVESGSHTVAEAMVERAAKLAWAAAVSPGY